MDKLKNSKAFYTFGSTVAPVALFLTAFNVNSTCIWVMHQEEIPKAAQKLRKF